MSVYFTVEFESGARVSTHVVSPEVGLGRTVNWLLLTGNVNCNST